MEMMSARELSRYLKINEKKVYKLALETDMPSMKIGGKVSFAKELIDKWILEITQWVRPLLLAGCGDDLLGEAVDHYNALNGGLAYYSPVGSINGLKALRDHKATMACVRMPGVGEKKDELTYVDRYLDMDDYVMAPLFLREQGIIVEKGNPKKIWTLKDIAAKGATFINRNHGSGTRRLLDSLLAATEVDTTSIEGYEVEVDSHFQVGLNVLNGSCDAGFGIRQVADELGLDHVALYRERISMVVPKERYYSSDVKAFLEFFEQSF